MLKIDKILLDVKKKIDIVFLGIKKNKKKIHDSDMRCGKLSILLYFEMIPRLRFLIQVYSFTEIESYDLLISEIRGPLLQNYKIQVRIIKKKL